MLNGAAFGIGGAIDDPTDTGMAYGAGAHGAGFKRYVKPEIGQSVIAEGLARRPQRPYFGVRRGVM